MVFQQRLEKGKESSVKGILNNSWLIPVFLF